MLFHRLGRNAEAVCYLLIGTLVEYPQRKGRAALPGQAIDGLLDKAISLVSEQLRLRRLTFSFDP
jgi:hypothetical protein